MLSLSGAESVTVALMQTQQYAPDGAGFNSREGADFITANTFVRKLVDLSGNVLWYLDGASHYRHSPRNAQGPLK
jgi:hypothetical protein